MGQKEPSTPEVTPSLVAPEGEKMPQCEYRWATGEGKQRRSRRCRLPKGHLGGCDVDALVITWEQAARRVGEELVTNGPVGYGDFTAAEWLQWAIDTLQQPPSLVSPAPQEQK